MIVGVLTKWSRVIRHITCFSATKMCVYEQSLHHANSSNSLISVRTGETTATLKAPTEM